MIVHIRHLFISLQNIFHFHLQSRESRITVLSLNSDKIDFSLQFLRCEEYRKVLWCCHHAWMTVSKYLDDQVKVPFWWGQNTFLTKNSLENFAREGLFDIHKKSLCIQHSNYQQFTKTHDFSRKSEQSRSSWKRIDSQRSFFVRKTSVWWCYD